MKEFYIYNKELEDLKIHPMGQLKSKAQTISNLRPNWTVYKPVPTMGNTCWNTVKCTIGYYTLPNCKNHVDSPRKVLCESISCINKSQPVIRKCKDG